MEKLADKEELLLLLNADGTPTNQFEKRSVVHSNGLWHREVGVIPINKKGQILLQRRSRNKKSYPNCWALCAGHVVGNQTTLQAAAMEANEELGGGVHGISETDLKLLVVPTKNEREDNKCYATCYYLELDLPLSKFKKQDEEVEELKWVELADFEKMVESEKNCIFKNNEYYKSIIGALKAKLGL